MKVRHLGREADRPAGNVDAVAEWRSPLTVLAAGLLLYETLSGLAVYLLPFSLYNQFSVLLHTLFGLAMLLPVGWFVWRHWRVRKKGNLSHYQLLGYLALGFLLACVLTGLVLTWQGVAGPAIGYGWDLAHLATGICLALFIGIHLAAIIVRKVSAEQSRLALTYARRRFYVQTALGSAVLLSAAGLWVLAYEQPDLIRGFADDYNWRFGEDRPFAPSLARLDYSGLESETARRILDVIGTRHRERYLAAQDEWRRQPVGYVSQVNGSLEGLAIDPSQRRDIDALLAAYVEQVQAAGSVTPRALAGSEGCGSSGCHDEIYREWLPSAHRYSSLDHMFQRVQELMVEETAPEYTRYCAGCHDPISLFSGAKNPGNITLSAEGSNEGSSCIACHSMVRTDIQGNGDYTLRAPVPYAYEWREGGTARFLRDFLIRTYPRHHVDSYTRPLLRTAEFCGACHKQYVDREVNVDIGKVQGQNQYDSWKNSRWYHEGDPAKTVGCRECHMPLSAGNDPARGDDVDYNRSGDDGSHRSHRMLASNQYIPTDQGLEGAEEHVALIEKWLRGEYEIPEIADKWTSGPVVRMALAAPEQARPGEQVQLVVTLTNNKTGHDFPTGPLDMIESWVELRVTDGDGTVLYQAGGLDADDKVERPPVIFKADGFDRQGDLIDRHNLWDLVGASYKRAMYPGVTDSVAVEFQCPSMARDRVMAEGQKPGERADQFAFTVPAATGEQSLEVTATLWYRKANSAFLDRIYGPERKVRSPVTAISSASAVIRVSQDVAAAY